MRILSLIIVVFTSCSIAFADDAKPLPPIKPIPRLLPPAGPPISTEDRFELHTRQRNLTRAIAEAKLDPALQPDVEIYTKAVRWALDFDEFYDAKKDVAKAHAALDSAQKRLDELKQNKSSWTTQRGLLARGYRSDIDDSVQPYGLHIPANLDLSKPVPLLVWLHGRGDKETDLHFIATREKNKGEFAPDWCITLHPYGRGTIGFKFAGEIDVLDAIESVKKRYKIDDDRIALAGFSMGGAGAWHIGAHYADRFCVVHAGAGFVETAKYNKLTPDKYPSWYEQKLWGWYDVPNYTRNLFNVPVIAYSGEKDKQIQAAREMEAAFKAEGRELNHIIGPGFEHKYEPKAKEEILKQIKAAVDKGREKWPKQIHLQTRTTRYGNYAWLHITSMEKAWAEARADAKLIGDDRIEITTKNVNALWVEHPWPKFPDGVKKVRVVIDGRQFEYDPTDERLWPWQNFAKVDGRWEDMEAIKFAGKSPDHWERSDFEGGPIDEAFMSPFLVVLPSGKAASDRERRWVEFELDRLRTRWRALFRGDLREKIDSKVTVEDREKFNLILWGNPDTNTEMGYALVMSLRDNLLVGGSRLFGYTPVKHHAVKWTQRTWTIGDKQFSADDHICIARLRQGQGSSLLTVLNSGPTFREGHDRTNSQQTPKLPDWAIIGLDKDPDAFAPGEIKAAGFFDENWKVKAEEKK